MSNHTLEWSPEPRNVQPEIAAAVDAVEGRLEPIGFDGHGAPIYVHQLPPVVKFLPAPIDYSAPAFTEERIKELGGLPEGEPILTRFDIELAGFDYDLVMEAGKKSAP